MRFTMPCADDLPSRHRLAGWLAVFALIVAGVAGCHTAPHRKVQSVAPGGVESDATMAAAPGAYTSERATLKNEPVLRLGPPGTPRSWEQVRQQAARRLIAANPNTSYTGRVPDVLLAIPVFSVQLNGDGSIRHIDVMRYPHQARETVDIAKAALHRAEPFGDVSHLPKPWRFTETFLFNDQRQFKPLTFDR